MIILMELREGSPLTFKPPFDWNIIHGQFSREFNESGTVRFNTTQGGHSSFIRFHNNKMPSELRRALEQEIKYVKTLI